MDDNYEDDNPYFYDPDNDPFPELHSYPTTPNYPDNWYSMVFACENCDWALTPDRFGGLPKFCPNCGAERGKWVLVGEDWEDVYEESKLRFINPPPIPDPNIPDPNIPDPKPSRLPKFIQRLIIWWYRDVKF